MGTSGKLVIIHLGKLKNKEEYQVPQYGICRTQHGIVHKESLGKTYGDSSLVCYIIQSSAVALPAIMIASLSLIGF
jgi:hypothetical protein